MRLEQFQYVVEIAKCRSMSKAAKQLFLSQPALSTSISNLETEVGFQIFQRSFQGVALTEQGERFLEIAQRIVADLESIPNLSRREETTPTVNLAAVPAACNALVMDLIQQLRQENPNTIINIQELRPMKVLTALEEHTADLCVGIHVPNTQDEIQKQAARMDIQMEDVFQDTMCAYLPKHHPLASQRMVYRRELAGETPIFFSEYIRMDAHSTTPDEIQSNHNYFTFTDQSSMKRAIARGLGYAVLPWQMSVDDIYVAQDQIAAVPLADEELRLTTFLAYRRNTVLSPTQQRALALLRQLYRQLQVKQQRQTRPCTP